MEHAYVLTGELREDARSLLLDEPLPLPAGKVWLTVHSHPPAPKPSYDEVLAEIHARLKAAGHVPPTREEVDRYIAEERASWD